MRLFKRHGFRHKEVREATHISIHPLTFALYSPKVLSATVRRDTLSHTLPPATPPSLLPIPLPLSLAEHCHRLPTVRAPTGSGRHCNGRRLRSVAATFFSYALICDVSVADESIGNPQADSIYAVNGAPIVYAHHGLVCPVMTLDDPINIFQL
jgi:hypothetical protein